MSTPSQTPDDGPPKKSVNVAPLYVMMWEGLVETARAKGYAVAVHGSLNRDLDVVAVPWTDEAVPAEELVAAISERLCWIRENDAPVVSGPEEKPHGRRAWTIPFMANWAVDLSVMPRTSADIATALREAVEEREALHAGLAKQEREDYQQVLAVRILEAEQRGRGTPFCQDTGEWSIAGTCSRHNGDACLILPGNVPLLIQRGYEKGRTDERNEFAASLESLAKQAKQRGREEEREACAKVAEHHQSGGPFGYPGKIAEFIRSRGRREGE